MLKTLAVLLCLSFCGCALDPIQTIGPRDAMDFYMKGYIYGDPKGYVEDMLGGNIDSRSLDMRIGSYLNGHPATADPIVKDMKKYRISKGMTKEQVLAVIGRRPDKNQCVLTHQEIWLYGKNVTLFGGKAFIITFKGGFVDSIVIKYWDPCPQCN